MIVLGNKVLVTLAEVREFKARFPGDDLGERAHWFEFDHLGNVTDSSVYADSDCKGATALESAARVFHAAEAHV